MRLTGTAVDCYKYLEPLYNDYRKVKTQNRNGGEFILAQRLNQLKPPISLFPQLFPVLWTWLQACLLLAEIVHVIPPYVFSHAAEFELMHVDEFIDELLHAERVCDIILPRLQVHLYHIYLYLLTHALPQLRPTHVCLCVCVAEKTRPWGDWDDGSTYQCSGGRPGWGGEQWRRGWGRREGRTNLQNTVK